MVDCSTMPDLLTLSKFAIQSTLLSATFSEWRHTEQHPRAVLQAALGEAGEIATETAAILAMHGVGSHEFSKDVIDCLPEHPYRIPELEVSARKDCRLYCADIVFCFCTTVIIITNTRVSEHALSSASIQPLLAIWMMRCMSRLGSLQKHSLIMFLFIFLLQRCWMMGL
jgi:hypothetical protein